MISLPGGIILLRTYWKLCRDISLVVGFSPSGQLLGDRQVPTKAGDPRPIWGLVILCKCGNAGYVTVCAPFSHIFLNLRGLCVDWHCSILAGRTPVIIGTNTILKNYKVQEFSLRIWISWLWFCFVLLVHCWLPPIFFFIYKKGMISWCQESTLQLHPTPTMLAQSPEQREGATSWISVMWLLARILQHLLQTD